MRVGVIPQGVASLADSMSIPHASGGDPGQGDQQSSIEMVFPMRVGVIPNKQLLQKILVSIPHASGGDPTLNSTLHNLVKYSPCEWG